MGLGSSKVPHKVIKVTPIPDKEEEEEEEEAEADADGSGQFSGRGNGTDWRRLKRTTSAGTGSDLPPLRERLPAGHLTGALPSLRQVPRAISFDINVEAGESSIIKKHPPRRFQRLEPINRFTVITAEELLKNQQATSTCKTQGQVQAEIAKQFSRRRQQMQKMQYEKKRQQEVIHLQKQAELMTTSQKETQNNEQKIKNHRAKKSRGKAQSHEQDQYHIAGEANDIFTAGYGEYKHIFLLSKSSYLDGNQISRFDLPNARLNSISPET
ncbi:factor associated with metabolism and energy-like isoform X2 [Narcine bancroftii]|uniref:factor associated with metabolism and energy-like isoform X2 n=1 Tax=Narcine bancroftii TaxID=1343680 RepID=UPI003831C848